MKQEKEENPDIYLRQHPYYYLSYCFHLGPYCNGVARGDRVVSLGRRCAQSTITLHVRMQWHQHDSSRMLWPPWDKGSFVSFVQRKSYVSLMGWLNPAPAISMTQIFIDSQRQIRLRKGIKIWQVLLPPNPPVSQVRSVHLHEPIASSSCCLAASLPATPLFDVMGTSNLSLHWPSCFLLPKESPSQWPESVQNMHSASIACS